MVFKLLRFLLFVKTFVAVGFVRRVLNTQYHIIVDISTIYNSMIDNSM